MELNFGKELPKRNKKDNFLEQLQERLEKMEQELVIDRFEGEKAICENRKNGQIVELDKKILPQEVREGSVLKWKNGSYQIDQDKQKEIEERIKQKMKDIWN